MASSCARRMPLLGSARDAAERVVVDYDPREPVIGVAAASLPQAPQIWPDAPGNTSELRPAPCRRNALGVKGVGEAGTTAALAAVMGAVADALPAGATIDMPATPERVW
jgi:CO/xanthine dehydrogenase Mo-binding subunit